MREFLKDFIIGLVTLIFLAIAFAVLMYLVFLIDKYVGLGKFALWSIGTLFSVLLIGCLGENIRRDWRIK